MNIMRLLKLGLVAILMASLTTVEGRPKKYKEKPDRPKPERKIDREKIKDRLKAAFEKLKNHRGEAKKKGQKIKNDKNVFGKLVRDDAKIKELRDAFKEASKKRWANFDKDKWKDATDEEKKALREQMAASRKEWIDQVKAPRKEVHARIKEIRDEFKNKRDEVIDGNNPGE